MCVGVCGVRRRPAVLTTCVDWGWVACACALVGVCTAAIDEDHAQHFVLGAQVRGFDGPSARSSDFPLSVLMRQALWLMQAQSNTLWFPLPLLGLAIVQSTAGAKDMHNAPPPPPPPTRADCRRATHHTAQRFATRTRIAPTASDTRTANFKRGAGGRVRPTPTPYHNYTRQPHKSTRAQERSGVNMKTKTKASMGRGARRTTTRKR